MICNGNMLITQNITKYAMKLLKIHKNTTYQAWANSQSILNRIIWKRKDFKQIKKVINDKYMTNKTKKQQN